MQVIGEDSGGVPLKERPEICQGAWGSFKGTLVSPTQKVGIVRTEHSPTRTHRPRKKSTRTMVSTKPLWPCWCTTP
eukprot:8308308-Lingulodinium_polyedra.AAC.1